MKNRIRDLFNAHTLISNFVDESPEWKDDVSFQNRLMELYTTISLYADGIEDKREEVA